MPEGRCGGDKKEAGASHWDPLQEWARMFQLLLMSVFTVLFMNESSLRAVLGGQMGGQRLYGTEGEGLGDLTGVMWFKENFSSFSSQETES